MQFLLLESNVHEIIIEEYSSDLASSYRLTIIAERRHACHQFRSSGLTFFLRSRTFTSTFVVALESMKWLWTASVKSGLPSAFIDYKSSNETKKYAVHLLTFWSGSRNFWFFFLRKLKIICLHRHVEVAWEMWGLVEISENCDSELTLAVSSLSFCRNCQQLSNVTADLKIFPATINHL